MSPSSDEPESLPKLSKYQRSHKRVMARSEILFHEKNARMIDPSARRKLKESMKGGYVGGITVNTRTNKLIAGHQRLDILDELHKGEEYSLEIDAVDLSQEEEIEYLVKLNNRTMQGDYDLDMLALQLPELDLEAAGFDRIEVELLFPDLDVSNLFGEEKESPGVKADAETINKMREAKKAAYQKGKTQEDAGFVLHVVFGDSAEKDRFLKLAGLTATDDYLPGLDLAIACNVDLK